MIKVTLKNGDVYYYKSIINVCDGAIKLVSEQDDLIYGKYHDYIYIGLIEIEKIEKQVKDLTLDEIAKLKFSITEMYFTSDGHKEFCIYNRDNRYSLDDYVDITALVKGE